MPAIPAHGKFAASQRTGEFAGTSHSQSLASIIKMGSLNKIKAISIFILFLVACSKEEDLHLKILFENLEKNIENNLLLNEFKTIPQDSLHLISHLFDNEMIELREEKVLSLEQETIIDSIVKDWNWETRNEILMYAFQNYLNSESFNIETIQVEVIKQQEKRIIESKKEQELRKRELLKIIESNNSNWNSGDTLDLIFQLDTEDNYKTIFYRLYPLSLDFSIADDTLKMKGVLISKYIDNPILGKSEDESNKYFKLRFKIKVLKLNPPEVYKFANQIKIGDEFILHLDSYGRLIE